MPTFYASGTTIQLSTANLEAVITKEPSINKSATSTGNIEQAGDALAKGSIDGTLAEDMLVDEKTQSHLRYLGSNRDMPFFLERAGAGFLAADRTGEFVSWWCLACITIVGEFDFGQAIVLHELVTELQAC